MHFDFLAGGGCVVAASAHLARELQRRFDHNRRELGKRAWPSADVLPYRAYAQRAWRESHAERAAKILLSAQQLTAVWESIIAEDIAGAEKYLWNTHATARLAVEAWQLAQDFCIPLANCAHSAHEDHRRWAKWARRYQKKCAAQNWSDEYALGEELISALQNGAQLANKTARFVGFDQLQPRQLALCDALRASGIDVQIETPPQNKTAQTKVTARACETQTEEWLHAAHWAREKLVRAPHLRIAIVTPNLGKHARAIEHACRQLLRPPAMLTPCARAALPYHISLGEKLGEYPVVQSALGALAAFSGAKLPLDDAAKFLRAPFLRGGAQEMFARARMEVWWRRNLPHQISFAQLQNSLSPQKDSAAKPHCPILLDALRKASPLLRDAKSAKPAAHWTRVFADYLRHLGWPGGHCSSDEFQAARAFRRELRNLALLEAVRARMPARAALAWLRRRVAEQIFQVEAHDAPLQVLSVSEAAGQQFDALWFGGVTESEWPRPHRPNPFIAAPLQQHAGAPHASSEAAYAHAELQQRRLLASAPEVTLSYARMFDDAENLPSALLDALLQKTARENCTAHANFETPAHLIAAHKPALETFSDARAPKFAHGETAGGVALIEDQAQCPFRAFAAHRLGAKEIEMREQGFSARDTGALLHDALQEIWLAIGDSKTLHALGEAELGKVIADAAQSAAEKRMRASGCGANFLQIQIDCARAVLNEWLLQEKLRAATFRALHLEHKTELPLDGVTLRMRIDRIDQLEDGRRVLIDYKTGAAVEAAHNWCGERTRAPQLPLYALAAEARDAHGAPPAAFAFGKVRRGECAFHGVARDDAFTKDSPAQKHMPPFARNKNLHAQFSDWDAMLAHWQNSLQKLAREFAGGDARVEPQPGACKHCSLQTLCRIETPAN